ncbi:hypothetical protein EMCRGX_G000497 [Ephydatia muelleri]
MQRSSVVKKKEKKYWDELDYRYMTDESDGELDGKTVKETHRPSWRSSALNKLIEKLDNRLVKKRGAHYMGFTRLPRSVGVSSLSNAPENAPAWAVTTTKRPDEPQLVALSEVQNSQTLQTNTRQQSSSELLDTSPAPQNGTKNRRRLTYTDELLLVTSPFMKIPALVHSLQDELLLVKFPFMKITALVHSLQDEMLLVKFPFMKIRALVHSLQDELLLVKPKRNVSSKILDFNDVMDAFSSDSASEPDDELASLPDSSDSS